MYEGTWVHTHWWVLVMSACANCNPTHEKEICKTDSLSTFFSSLPSLEGSSTHFYSNEIYCKKQQKDIYLWSKVVCWLCPTEALWEHLWAGIRVWVSKVGWMDKVIGLHVNFLLAQANGWACVDFGCNHPIDGLFWNLPIYFLGFFSKYECWVTELTMSLYHFILFELLLAFLYHEVSHHYEM
jgi:hypothetical protein